MGVSARFHHGLVLLGQGFHQGGVMVEARIAAAEIDQGLVGGGIVDPLKTSHVSEHMVGYGWPLDALRLQLAHPEVYRSGDLANFLHGLPSPCISLVI
ncbi:hypothetical protein [Sinorhizobium meliloti]|uniref:hypothetical protein n=1 Tax=Rhizobium meliloti TaxID=382 RepID=UPI001F44FAF6|nr:hypothetical protein [Sinorhizobium meliloti]